MSVWFRLRIYYYVNPFYHERKEDGYLGPRNSFSFLHFCTPNRTHDLKNLIVKHSNVDGLVGKAFNRQTLGTKGLLVWFLVQGVLQIIVYRMGVEEPMKYQALRPHFFSMGGWGWWWVGGGGVHGVLVRDVGGGGRMGGGMGDGVLSGW